MAFPHKNRWHRYFDSFLWRYHGSALGFQGPAGSISGTASVVFGSDATLTAIAAMVGTASVIFGTSADLVDGGGAPPGGTSTSRPKIFGRGGRLGIKGSGGRKGLFGRS